MAGQTKYYSILLLYCIFACAAWISDHQDTRALAVSRDDDLDDEQPGLIKRATSLLEQELRRPQITSVQSSASTTVLGQMTRSVGCLQNMPADWLLTLACIEIALTFRCRTTFL